VFNVEIQFEVEDIKTISTDVCDDLNVQTCKYIMQDIMEEDQIICNIKLENLKGVFEQGSHTLTKWLYFTIRTMGNVFLNVLFNICDGSASTISIKEKSSYAMIMFFGNIGGLFPNWITGPIVDHFSFGTDYVDCLTNTLVAVNDFKVPFFIQDACFAFILMITIFFLKIEIKKPEKKVSLKEEFYWLLNPAPIGFYFLNLGLGISFGALQTYLFVFAQDVLGASTTFLGYMQFGVCFSPLLVLPFAKQIINYLGVMNTICWSMVFYIGRFVAYGLTYSSPPYPFIALGSMEFLANLYFVACINYCSVIAPQTLIATSISISSVMCWIVGQGLGALLAGVVVDRYNMRVMFVVFGIAGSAFFFCYWVLYHLVIKHYEVDHTKHYEVDHTKHYEVDHTKNTGDSTEQNRREQPKKKEDNREINLTGRIISSRL